MNKYYNTPSIITLIVFNLGYSYYYINKNTELKSGFNLKSVLNKNI